MGYSLHAGVVIVADGTHAHLMVTEPRYSAIVAQGEDPGEDA